MSHHSIRWFDNWEIAQLTSWPLLIQLISLISMPNYSNSSKNFGNWEGYGFFYTKKNCVQS